MFWRGKWVTFEFEFSLQRWCPQMLLKLQWRVRWSCTHLLSRPHFCTHLGCNITLSFRLTTFLCLSCSCVFYWFILKQLDFWSVSNYLETVAGTLSFGINVSLLKFFACKSNHKSDFILLCLYSWRTLMDFPIKKIDSIVLKLFERVVFEKFMPCWNCKQR